MLIHRLDGVRETGPGRWVAKCPAHDDESPSLSLRELEDGRVLVHDFGGCAAIDVVEAVGLRMSDLFPAPLGQHITPTKSKIPATDLLLLMARESLRIL